MPVRKRLALRLYAEPLEDRLNPTPTLLQNISLPGAVPQPGIYSPAPVVADLDGDGQDEVLATGGNILYAYKMNPATGQMAIDHTYSQGGPQGPLNSTPIVVTLASGPAIFLGDGHGTIFGWDARTGNLLPGWPQTVAYYNAALPLPTEIFAANQIYGGLAAGDLDGDGVPEIVATSVNHEVTAFHANGTVMWRFNNDDTIFDSVAIGDLNGDGKPEVVVGGDSSASSIYWDGGRINCLSWDGKREWVKMTDQVVWSSPVLADLYGNGTLDVIVGTGYNYPVNGVAPFPGNEVIGLDPNGNVLPGWPYVTGASSIDARTRSSPAIADLTGQGNLDVTVADASGNLTAINGSGQKIWAVQASTQMDILSSPIVADIDNDGKPDVLLEVPEGKVEAFSGATGAMTWEFDDGLGHLTAPAIGHFKGDSSYQLAMVSQSFDTQANELLSPSNLLIFDLGDSTLTPPWGQSRQDATADAVARPNGYTVTYLNQLYQGTLDRAPTADELASALPTYSHTQTLLAPTLQFLNSPSLQQTQLTALYENYLHRGIDPGGLSFWTGVLNSGQAYSYVAAQLAASSEAFTLSGGTNPDWVALLYQSALNRQPGPGEDSFWINTLNANPGDRFQIALGILRSAEATNREIDAWYAAYVPGGQSTPPADQFEAIGWDLRTGVPENTSIANLLVSRGDYVSTMRQGAWIRALYADLLQRASTTNDIVSWLTQMEAGLPASSVVSDFVNSSEYHRILIGAWIEKFLHRAASQSDLSYFGGLLDRGQSWTSVQQIFLSSSEYFSTRGGGNVSQFVNQVFLDQVGHTASAAQISFWATQPNVQALLPQVLMTAQEYYLWTIGGDTFTSMFGTFLRRFASTQPDNSRLYPVGTVPNDQGLAAQWTAGAQPSDILVEILSSPEYMQLARDKAFWSGARWMS